jgi:hypothetical protein
VSYGLTFTNNSDVVTLDSEFARLVVLSSGTWSGTSALTITFPQVITTTEPPLIFVRPNQSNTFAFCNVNGSSGSWSGFSFRTNGAFSSGNWFASGFKSSPKASYGLRLWDENNVLLFDNDTPCAQFTRTLTSWTYLGYSQVSPGVYRLSWTAPSPLDTGDYMLLNNIAMDMPGTTSRQGNLYALWEYGNNRLLLQAIGVDLPTAQYIPVVFAKQIA